MTIGLPHHGKSFESARQLIRLIRRNHKWFKKSGIKRFVYSNLVVNEQFFEKNSEFREYIKYWKHPIELVDLQDVDIIWDEIARHLDSRAWDRLSFKIKTLIQEHDKMGIDIYANTQSPMQVDIMFRRNCESIKRIWKIFGSRRPSPTKPAVRFIWGLCQLLELDRSSYSSEESGEKYKLSWWGILDPGNYRWIDRFTCSFFNTRQQIRGNLPPLEHIERFCEDKMCSLHTLGKVIHA